MSPTEPNARRLPQDAKGRERPRASPTRVEKLERLQVQDPPPKKGPGKLLVPQDTGWAHGDGRWELPLFRFSCHH